MSQYWPVHDVVLRCDSIELRPLTEADLPALIAVLPDDVDLDPSISAAPGSSGAAARATVLARSYWQSMATWSTAAWCLPFTVRFGADILGVQTLEADRFAELRTVDTASWLTTAARGQGVGTRMRTAVLDTAFTQLDAQFAITSAVLDNAASLGVSRALGYRDNGRSRIVTAHGMRTLQHLRLSGADWAPRWPVSVTGLDACRAMFGR